MKNVLNLIVILAVVGVGATASASGWKCKNRRSDNPHVRVQLYNQTSPDLGTSNPAVLIVHIDGETVLTAHNNSRVTEIIKTIQNGDSYYEVDGNEDIDADLVSLKIPNFIEGSTSVPENTRKQGTLFLAKDGEVTKYVMVCRRYLKTQ